MDILYNISIWLYVLLINATSLFNSKAKLWKKGRKNIFNQLQKTLQNDKKIVWFHCASLGEFEQIKTILIDYKVKYPHHKILLTFFSSSGYESKKNTPLCDWVFYLPADTKSNAKKFIQIVKPIKAIFVKYEFWFNYMHELKQLGIPLYSISSVFRKNQLFFINKWWGKQLKNVYHFFVQDENSANLLNKIGINKFTVVGDTRFDCVFYNSKNLTKNSLIEQFCKNKRTIICGSTWPKDETILIKYIKNHPNNNYIIAPHEMYYISKLKKRTNGLLYSEANTKNILKKNILIINTIGILSNIYQYGHIAYIGGGFEKGIHNILEAITFGLPVVFGPKYHKFNEAKEYIHKKGAITISNYSDLISAFKSFENFDNSIAHKFIKKNTGATKKIINLL
tara:strand:+ start:4661 stop:5845 length:1185 start_codon:yes stop_codon:yes gene_type:complete